MGGHNSRLHGNGGEVLPTRIRHRMEELRQRKSKAPLRGEEEANTFSKKQPNYDGVDEDKKGSPNETQPAKRVEKLSKVVPLPISEPVCNELHNEEKRKDVEKKGGIKHEEGHDSGDEEEEEIESGRLIGPGSPSFKIYCNEPDNKKEEEFHDSNALGENQIVVVHQKSPCANSFESFAGISRNSNEIIEMKSAPKRKGNKKNSIGGTMKKNILHMKHLRMNRMNPMLACTGSNGRRLLTDH